MAVTVEVHTITNTDPCPRAEVTVTGITGGFVTVTRTAGNVVTEVRGMARRETTGTSFVVDFEVELAVPVTYTAVGTDAAGNVTDAAVSSDVVYVFNTSNDPDYVWLQDPLDPAASIPVVLADGSLDTLSRARSAELDTPIGASMPTGRGGRLTAFRDVPFAWYTLSDEQAADCDALLINAFPMLIRSIAPIPLPRSAYVAVQVLDYHPEGRLGNEVVTWGTSITIMRPPAAAVAKAVNTYGSVIRLHEGYTYADVMAAHPGTYLDFIRHPKPGA